MYLAYRDSIVLNHNPFMMFKDDPENNDQVLNTFKNKKDNKNKINFSVD